MDWASRSKRLRVRHRKWSRYCLTGYLLLSRTPCGWVQRLQKNSVLRQIFFQLESHFYFLWKTRKYNCGKWMSVSLPVFLLLASGFWRSGVVLALLSSRTRFLLVPIGPDPQELGFLPRSWGVLWVDRSRASRTSKKNLRAAFCPPTPGSYCLSSPANFISSFISQSGISKLAENANLSKWE